MFSMQSDLGPRRPCAEKYVTVMSVVPGCDVTTVQQHYTGSTSTPPRVARLCQIREASLADISALIELTDTPEKTDRQGRDRICVKTNFCGPIPTRTPTKCLDKTKRWYWLPQWNQWGLWEQVLSQTGQDKQERKRLRIR